MAGNGERTAARRSRHGADLEHHGAAAADILSGNDRDPLRPGRGRPPALRAARHHVDPALTAARRQQLTHGRETELACAAFLRHLEATLLHNDVGRSRGWIGMRRDAELHHPFTLPLRWRGQRDPLGVRAY